MVVSSDRIHLEEMGSAVGSWRVEGRWWGARVNVYGGGELGVSSGAQQMLNGSSVEFGRRSKQTAYSEGSSR